MSLNSLTLKREYSTNTKYRSHYKIKTNNKQSIDQSSHTDVAAYQTPGPKNLAVTVGEGFSFKSSSKSNLHDKISDQRYEHGPSTKNSNILIAESEY